jgi:hypothetical protein
METAEMPPETYIESYLSRSTYNNGIIEIAFNKRKQIKPKGTRLNVD